MTKPSLPQGTRDFSPEIVRKRNFILETIRNVFELYGFQPLETPAMENIETLMGKYGEEGDRLIFKILNNGLDHPNKRDQAKNDFENLLQGKNVRGITERALRYDLTIPFARFVAMNHNSLILPFRRYQIQPVWRADRPQKGRYREFWQCDADIVGSTTMFNELELIHIYIDVFSRLRLTDFQIQINHRKILTALAELTGSADNMNAIANIIDKIDKIGLDKVSAEFKQKGFNDEQISVITDYLSINGNNADKIGKLRDMFMSNNNGREAIDDLGYILGLFHADTKAKYKFNVDLSLARGLNYYTGLIIEIKAPPKVKIGSMGGGGRYDDLTGLFGVKNIPGVGISFGVDRIYDVMEELKLFPEEVNIGTQVLFFNLGEYESRNAFSVMQQLRQNGISCELYHETAKFDKQFKFAEKKNIPWVVIIGTLEMTEKTCSVKNLERGTQQTITQQALLNYDFRQI